MIYIIEPENNISIIVMLKLIFKNGKKEQLYIQMTAM